MTLSRTSVARLQPGDHARTRRVDVEFEVAGVFVEHGGWRVVDTEGHVRRFAQHAVVLVDTARCAGQTDLLTQAADR